MTPSDSVEPAGDRQHDDDELIRRIKDGDKLAYCDFYDRFSRPLYSLALRILHDPIEAEDVVQEIFVTVWETAGNLDQSRGSALNWVISLTRNRAIERLRSRDRRGTVTSQSPADLTGGHSSTGPESADSSVLNEKIPAARAALTTLPAEQLQALELAYFGSLNQEEIASQSGEPIGIVKSQIRRGLLKLRDLLA